MQRIDIHHRLSISWCDLDRDCGGWEVSPSKLGALTGPAGLTVTDPPYMPVMPDDVPLTTIPMSAPVDR